MSKRAFLIGPIHHHHIMDTFAALKWRGRSPNCLLTRLERLKNQNLAGSFSQEEVLHMYSTFLVTTHTIHDFDIIHAASNVRYHFDISSKDPHHYLRLSQTFPSRYRYCSNACRPDVRSAVKQPAARSRSAS